MIKIVTRLTLTAAVAGMTMGAVPAFAASHGVVKDAKITMPEARQIALKARPGGKIVHEELEKEGGGSGLRYSFDVKQGSKTIEVGVDAMTGKVLENAAESAAKEAGEKD
ncbi:PepSY domain-containing protein [Bradyrhizobium diazoefficiens]|nr:PepSY domain-containing protein [Bradyrhizobium diazoefficiens]QQO19137.1 PepSY domain-containing protein [Bradyrhizobium diazoefficiens]